MSFQKINPFAFDHFLNLLLRKRRAKRWFLFQITDFWGINPNIDILFDWNRVMMNVAVQVNDLLDNPHHHWVMGHIVLTMIHLNQCANIMKSKLRLTLNEIIIFFEIFKEGPGIMVALDQY